MFQHCYSTLLPFKPIQQIVIGILGLCLTHFSYAHPHSWVDLKTHIQGEDGMITGFQMEWTFDAMTSAYMLDGQDMSDDKQPQTLREISASVMNNMMYEHYFTYFYDGNTPIKYKIASNDKMTRHKAKLVLSFELALSKPHPISSDSLKLLIFEPSYFIDMSWKSSKDVSLSASLARQCRLEMIEPNPTPEQMSYAMSLPADADPDNALGQLFTQTVNIHCASVPSA